MTGDDYTWDQMSVMERCEVLRSMVKNLEHDSHGHSRHHLPTPVDTQVLLLSSRIDDMSKRVADCEIDGHKMRELADRIAKRELVDDNLCERLNDLARRVAEIEKDGNVHAPVYFDRITAEPSETVHAADLARLRRVEKAARELIDTGCSIYRHTFPSMARKLMAALDSEPER